MINSLHELKSYYALNLSDIAIKPTYAWLLPKKMKRINLSQVGFIMESLGRGKRLYGKM